MRQAANLWRIAAREVGARWILIPAAILLGSLAMLAIRSLDLNRGDADGLLTGTWGSTLVISAIVGMSLLGDELANGRLSFYFVRPFAPSAIFGGKLVGGVILALVIQGSVIALVAVGLPAIAWLDSSLAARGLAVIVGQRILATFACVVLGMAAGIVIQSKTRWLIIDLACLVVVAVIATWVILHVTQMIEHGRHGDRAVPAGYAGHAATLQVGALAVAVLGLAIATARALARGRTDRGRAHATLSMTLWPIVMPAAGALLFATLAWF